MDGFLENRIFKHTNSMIFDSNKLDLTHFSDRFYDVCIAGAGFAGIVAARTLARRGLRVAVIEAGSTEFTDSSQSFYEGKIIGREYFDLAATRLRYFGGTSNHWSGWCRPLDEIDFEDKEYVEWSGWPIRRSDLEPHLAEATSILDIDQEFEDEVPTPIEPSASLIQIGYQFSPPTRMKDKYSSELENSNSIDVYLNLSVTDIRLSAGASKVEQFICRRADLQRVDQIILKSRDFILAMGGLEIPRILLNSNHQQTEGIGNRHNLVGRFFMDHPHFRLGNFRLHNPHFPALGTNVSNKERLRFWLCRSDSIRSLAEKFRGPIKCTNLRCWSPSSAFIKRKKILNCNLRIFSHYEPTSKPDGFNATLHAAFEQYPNPNSRVGLTENRDPFGLRRIALDWRLSRFDKRTARECAIEVGKKVAELDTGRLKIADWLLHDDDNFPGLATEEVAGHHHMGTTRMASQPDRGVVDKNCQVFDVDNLFIASSSVFPTCGHANPTLTIVQLALRLANFIATKKAATH